MIDLMNKKSISVELEGIAVQLKGAGDEESADRIHQLALAVNDGMYADAWAATDVHKMIDANAIVERYRAQKVIDPTIAWIEWGRNALIFAPLVVSWYYISQAADAYSKLINAESDQIRTPFLYLWQQGFNGRLAWWQTLSCMAFIDFFILLTVLALTVVVYTISNSFKTRREAEASKLSARLSHALAGAALCLATRKWTQPTSVVTDLKNLVQQFDQRTTGLLQRIEALNTVQQTQIKGEATYRSDLQATLTNLKTAIDGLRGINTTLASNVSSVSTAMNGVSTKLETQLHKIDQSLTLLGKHITTQEALLKEQQSWGANLKDSIEKLGKAAVAGETMANEQGKVTKELDALVKSIAAQQGSFLTSVSKQQAAQQQLENDARAVAMNTQTVVGEMQQCARDLRGYTQDMYDLVRRVAALVP
jgi:hypothetical protein